MPRNGVQLTVPVDRLATGGAFHLRLASPNGQLRTCPLFSLGAELGGAGLPSLGGMFSDRIASKHAGVEGALAPHCCGQHGSPNVQLRGVALDVT